MKIGIFDSGKGGTTTMAAIKKLLPNEEYFYIGDRENHPYGDKTDTELYQIVAANVAKLQTWGADLIVIACNTATTKCIKKLRLNYPEIIFVGIEPAIKPAAKSGAKNILVLATTNTAQSASVHNLINKNLKPDQNITVLACPGLADAIELDDKKQIRTLLDALLKDINAPDVIVLGCTHYSLIKNEIQAYFPNAKLIDGNDGVARHVYALIKNLPF